MLDKAKEFNIHIPHHKYYEVSDEEILARHINDYMYECESNKAVATYLELDSYYKIDWDQCYDV
jgi:hypothetical protein